MIPGSKWKRSRAILAAAMVVQLVGCGREPTSVTAAATRADHAGDAGVTPGGRTGVAQQFSSVYDQYGTTVVGYELIRLYYRYGFRRYGRSGRADRFDRAFAAAARRHRMPRERVRRLFRDAIFPYEDRLRSTFDPALRRLPFWGDRLDMKYAMESAGERGGREDGDGARGADEGTEAEAEAETCPDGTPAEGKSCRELAGRIWDPKHPLPTLHSAYGHSVRNLPVALPDSIASTAELDSPGDVEGVTEAELPETLSLEVPCETDLDCRVFGGRLGVTPGLDLERHARCGTGDEGYDWTEGQLETVDDAAGVCIYGPQWRPGHHVRVQGRHIWDTDARATLLRVADPDGTPLASDVVLTSIGEYLALGPDGDPLDLTEGVLFEIGETFTIGDYAPEYLSATNQLDFYHGVTPAVDPEIGVVNWPDIVDVPLPEDLPPGLYQLRVDYRPDALLDTIADPAAAAYYAGALPDTERALTNALYVRVRGDGPHHERYRFEFRAAKILEPQESTDDPVVSSRIYKLDLAAFGAAPDAADKSEELLAQADELEDALVAGEMPASISMVFEDTLWAGDDFSPGSAFPVGFSTVQTLSEGEALLVFSELWEHDDAGVPDGLATAVDGLVALTVLVAKASLTQLGIETVVQFCTSGPACAVVVAAVLALALTVDAWEFFAAAEYLGMSMALYTLEQLRFLTRASDMGLGVDALRALHEKRVTPLPSLFEFHATFEYPADYPEDGKVFIDDVPAMDGEGVWDQSGGPTPDQYDEIRSVCAFHNQSSPLADDTSHYALHYQMTRLP